MKKWYQSKTVWLNTIGLGIVILQYFGEIDLIDPQYLGIILGFANIAIRILKTDQPIEKKLL